MDTRTNANLTESVAFKEWQNNLSLSAKQHAKDILLLDLIPSKLDIHDVSSPATKITQLPMKTIEDKTLTTISYYSHTDTVNPVVIYTLLIQLILSATNGNPLLAQLTTKVNQSLRFHYIENGENISGCILEGHLDMLKDLLDLKWMVLGEPLPFKNDDKSLTALTKMTVPGIWSCKRFSQLLPSSCYSSRLSLFQANQLGKLQKDINRLLHDGKEAKSPTLSKTVLSEKIAALQPEEQIILLGDIFVDIQNDKPICYRYKKPFFSIFEKSGIDIANDHINILTEKLIEILQTHKDPASLSEFIKTKNVQSLINFDPNTNKAINILLAKTPDHTKSNLSYSNYSS